MDKLEQLKVAVDTYKLLRTNGMPMLMPIIKQYSDWETCKIEISKTIHLHVEVKYEKITETTGIGASKADWKKAFIEVIYKDFWKKGHGRENIALEWLKTAFPAVTWEPSMTESEESAGVDIKGQHGTSIICVSVKGFAFKTDATLVEKLESKLKQIPSTWGANLIDIAIAYVDEDTKEVQLQPIVR